MNQPSARLGRGLALLVVGVLALLLFGGRPAPPAPSMPTRPTRPTPAQRPPPERATRAEIAAPAAPAPVRRQNAAPALRHAALDRETLCPGESTFLRMEASDPDDTDLRYQATFLSAPLGSPRFGFGRWIRVDAPPEVGRYSIIAAVEDPKRARDERPLELSVEACDAAPAFDVSQLRIRHVELDATVHELDLNEARELARRAGKTLEVRRWQFGDGSTGPGELRTRHAYPIDLERRYSYYLVSAEVSLDGEPARIEYGLTFYSYAAANLQGGYVALAADVERADRERVGLDLARRADGEGADERALIDYVVTFSNVTPYSALAHELELTCLDASGVPQARWREPLELTVPGDSSLEQSLQLDPRRCPGGASYELFGEAEGGYAVGGLWSYKLRPSAPPGDVRVARRSARQVLTGDAVREKTP